MSKISVLCPLTLALAAFSWSTQAAPTSGRVLIYANQNPPSACVALPDSPALGAEHFVTVLQEGKAIASAIALGSTEICAGNLQHGKSYRISLKQGLPLISGQKLAALDYDITIPAAKEELSFSPGTRLPLAENSFLQLSHTNVQAADFYLYKLNLRDLSALDLSLLLQNKLATYSAINLITQHASLVENRHLTLTNTPNTSVSTKLPLGEALKNSEGLLVALVKDASLNLGLPGDDPNVNGSLYDLHRTDKAFALKLINVSDLMLTALRGESLNVSLRSLKTAQPLKDVSVTLLARNNAILGSKMSDDNGMVQFDPAQLSGTQADSPWALLAQQGSDIALLPLIGGETTLPEEGVNDATYAPLNLYALTGRGIYRPGESVDITTLVRDEHGNASNAPITLIIRGPQQQELLRTLLQDNALGTYFTTYKLSSAAPRGMCTIEYLMGQRVLKTMSFNVADFVPASLKLQTLAQLDAPQGAQLTLHAAFNYGAAAASLPLSAQALLVPASTPLAHFTDYHFGPALSNQQALPLDFNLAPQATDKEGNATFTFTLPTLPYATAMEFNAQVMDLNHENATINTTVPMPLPQTLIGLKANDGTVKVICKSPNEQDVAAKLNYTIYQLQNHYQYVFAANSWQYRRQELKRPVHSGSMQLSGEGAIKLDLPDGRYLIEVSNDPLTASSSLEFSQGYASTLEANSPERVALYLDKDAYEPDDKATLSFVSPFAGSGQLILANRKVQAVHNFALKKGRNEISFDFKAGYAPGVKALVSLYAPLEDNPLGVVRALGLISVNADNTAQELKLSATLPDSVRPGGELDIPLHSNMQTPYYLQAYLVDSGILSLTNYQAGDAFASIFGPRALPLHLLDSYRTLMRQSDPYSQGYGAEAASFAKALGALSSLPRKSIALTLPPRLIDPATEPTPRLHFKVPDMQGELTLIVTAAGAQQIGSFKGTLQVKDKAVVNLALPRFIRAGDSVKAQLNVHNLQELDANFTLALDCKAPLKCHIATSLPLKAGQLYSKDFSLSLEDNAALPTTGEITLSVQGQDYHYAPKFSLPILPPYPETLSTALTYLKPQEKTEVNFDPTFASVKSASTMLSPLPGVNVPTFARQLKDLEPLGTSQLALKALSLSLLPDSDNTDIQLLIDKLSLTQRADGSWAQQEDYSDPYATAMATLSLSSLKSAGFAVMPETLERAFHALTLQGRSLNDAAQALSFYVRLKYDSASLSDLYYLASSDEVQSVQALSLLAACFKETGDDTQAEQLLSRALAAYADYYQLYAQLQALPDDNAHQNERMELQGKVRRLAPTPVSSLLFEGYQLLALHPQLLTAPEGKDLLDKLSSLNGTYVDEATLSIMLLTTNNAHLESQIITHQGLPPYEVVNHSAQGRFAQNAILGLTRTAPQAVAEGVTLDKDYFSLEGKPLKLPVSLKLNERIIVRLSGHATAPVSGNAIIRDGLPTGFAAAALQGMDPQVMDKLCPQGQSYSSREEFSDSEYLSVVSLWSNDPYCKLYLLRAAFVGSMSAFPASIYLQNAPAIRALNGALGKAFTIAK